MLIKTFPKGSAGIELLLISKTLKFNFIKIFPSAMSGFYEQLSENKTDTSERGDKYAY